MVVTGPCFDDYEQVFCHFEASLENIAPEGIPLDSRRVLCVVPQLGSVGRSSFKLQLIEKSDRITESKTKDYFASKWPTRLPFDRVVHTKEVLKERSVTL